MRLQRRRVATRRPQHDRRRDSGGDAKPHRPGGHFPALHLTTTNVLTCHGFQGGTAGDKIDFIFIGPGEFALCAEIDHTQAAGRFPSDHYPVSARIGIGVWK